MTRALNLTLPVIPDTQAQITLETLKFNFNVPMDKWLPPPLLEIVKQLLKHRGNGRENDYSKSIQQRIDDEVRESKEIHFLRVLLLPIAPPHQYLQVLTEYDDTRAHYTEVFRDRLPDVFSLIFGLTYAPPGVITNDSTDPEDPDNTFFWQFSRTFNIRALGTGTAQPGKDTEPEGYLFSAYGGKTVKDILNAIGASDTTTQFLKQLNDAKDEDIVSLAKNFAGDVAQYIS